MSDKVIPDFGCKNEKIPGAIGVNIDSSAEADVIHDLNQFQYPFEDHYADEIHKVKSERPCLSPVGRVL